MELLFAIGIGLTFAAGVYLLLRPTSFSVILGLSLITYGVNVLLIMGGRIGQYVPPLTLPGATGLADPLPQALVLTAIVIGFGMTAYLVVLALRAVGDAGTDAVDFETEQDEPEDPDPTTHAMKDRQP
ncbi:Na+/H+ antiporter subunit C [Sandaracinobacteroides sp. A072]|uniref:Na+/H+ antiporter subunit C n=1 Tax=Sandaracinobacteroides sp. A072 TaxID=3461146 RepID=UPI00404274CF